MFKIKGQHVNRRRAGNTMISWCVHQSYNPRIQGKQTGQTIGRGMHEGKYVPYVCMYALYIETGKMILNVWKEIILYNREKKQIYIHTHTEMKTQIHTNTHTGTHACTSTYTYTYTSARVFKTARKKSAASISTLFSCSSVSSSIEISYINFFPLALPVPYL